MDLDEAAVTRIARLARLAVREEEKPSLAADVSGILQWVAQLNEVDTDGVPQMTSVAALTLPRREDRVMDGNQQEAVLANAPKSDYGCFVVPKVME